MTRGDYLLGGTIFGGNRMEVMELDWLRFFPPEHD